MCKHTPIMYREFYEAHDIAVGVWTVLIYYFDFRCYIWWELGRPFNVSKNIEDGKDHCVFPG